MTVIVDHIMWHTLYHPPSGDFGIHSCLFLQHGEVYLHRIPSGLQGLEVLQPPDQTGAHFRACWLWWTLFHVSEAFSTSVATDLSWISSWVTHPSSTSSYYAGQCPGWLWWSRTLTAACSYGEMGPLCLTSLIYRFLLLQFRLLHLLRLLPLPPSLLHLLHLQLALSTLEDPDLSGVVVCPKGPLSHRGPRGLQRRK